MELVVGLDGATDCMLIQCQQVGGKDVVEQVKDLYRLEKPTTAGGYTVLPHGSGYLIPADCPDELPGEGDRGGIIGGRWTLPMFGMVAGGNSLCVIVDTWWDCDVEADHVPGEYSAVSFRWAGSLGRLGYARRMRIRFARGMDYAGMAKLYRAEAKAQGLVRTLEEKAKQTPVIRRYIDGVLFR